MTELSPSAAKVRAEYLDQLRRSLRGVSPDVADELQREIAAHIADALAARGAGDDEAIRDVIDRIGPPEDYVREIALYMMVDRGYREWSVPHMLRSTAFWALSTVGGAVAVAAFAGLYIVGLICLVAGLAGLAGGPTWPQLPLPPVVLAVIGGLGLVGVTVLVRWFIGQYVRRARPHAFGVDAGQSDWAARTSRRIVVAAVAGAVVVAGGGSVLGAEVLLNRSVQALLQTLLLSPLGLVLLAGAGLVLLAPVIGLLWSAWAEGPVPPGFSGDR